MQLAVLIHLFGHVKLSLGPSPGLLEDSGTVERRASAWPRLEANKFHAPSAISMRPGSRMVSKWGDPHTTTYPEFNSFVDEALKCDLEKLALSR
jgi:hypothetical protein